MKRCFGEKSGQLMEKYHDEEWGVPIHNDRKLFELLVLEGFQAGLSWSIVLKKRDAFRKAMNNFDPKKISKYKERDVKRLLQNPEIIRNRLKIESAINNAKKFLEVKKEFGSFSKYMWQFVGGKPVINKFKKMSDVPAKTELSDNVSKDLKKRGFKFVESTICYAYMQSIGIVNDHATFCFRYKQIKKYSI